MQIGKIEIPGLADLDAMLTQLGHKVATEIASKGIRASAELLQDAWSQGAPYDPNSRPKVWTVKSGERRSRDYGHLYQNIRVRPVKPQKEHAVVFKVTTGDAFWGYFREFGTVNQRAQPWARPILMQMKAACLHKQIMTIREGIEVVVGKGVVAKSNPTMTKRFGPMLANGRNG